MGRLVRLLIAWGVATVALVALPSAGVASAEEPSTATCAAEAPVRLLSGGPACTIVVSCPDGSAGCAFGASLTAASVATIGTAQATLRVVNADAPGQVTDFTCSAPAAIVASGGTAGCSTSATAFLPAGSRYSVTCMWTGSTISVSARVSCAAAFEPIGGE